MGPLHPLRPPHRRTHHIVLPPDQAHQGSARDGRLHLCGNGGGVDHTAESGTSHPGNDGELRGGRGASNVL
jgi:hypothetical protein